MGECLTQSPSRFTPGKKLGTLCTGDWVLLGTGLNRYDNLADTEVQTPDHPARCESLNLLRCTRRQSISTQRTMTVAERIFINLILEGFAKIVKLFQFFVQIGQSAACSQRCSVRTDIGIHVSYTVPIVSISYSGVYGIFEINSNQNTRFIEKPTCHNSYYMHTFCKFLLHIVI